ncbi:uncharacterized protein CTRU02_204634 [Colletotrichum truncatum]|uniref:Uncharacterized protein n=1 Tax=Colletotrichum truncatum TaxID=5467 RepID=A0ACC3ZCN3_COLTU|nr:uncharacterized protein CTRU02_02866 [Colletotrichum truncatum]KAF6797824.1 hypothetical protein CTRU02_02866 [Colletotrichum truncatum]
MIRWPRHWLSSGLSRRVFQRRCFHQSKPAPDGSVDIAIGSSGTITVDLHNVFRQSSSTPLVIYIPPVSPLAGTRPAVPGFLQPYPTAVINYRWSAPIPTSASHAEEEHDFTTPLQWPTPIHDILAGYTWIVENLRPDRNARRDLYIYSSHAGASLAASLALTESHHHERVAVRGLVAWNGIYNWTMFLPDHKVNKPLTARSRKLPPRPEEGSALHLLQSEMPDLFRKPVDLFDHFVSPSLFFQTAGMLVPPTFAQAAAVTSFLDQMTSIAPDQKPLDLMAAAATAFTAPRRSALIFPPRRSTLKLPATLFLHDSPPVPVTKRKTKKTVMTRNRRAGGHTFEAQTLELAGLMRRSLEKLEFKSRTEWDEDFDADAEAEKRVKVVDVGENKGMELGEEGQNVIRRWLEERFCS